MGQQRDAVNADPTFKQWVATLSGRPLPFQCRSDDAGGRKIFCLGSPRSITPFIEEGGGRQGGRRSAATSNANSTQTYRPINIPHRRTSENVSTRNQAGYPHPI